MAGNLADFVLIDKDGAVKRGSEIDITARRRLCG